MIIRCQRVWRTALLAAAAAATLVVMGGLFSSWASATSASPSSEKVTLKIGFMEPPDSMNPFIGWQDIVYEFYALEYLKLAGRDVETMQSTPGQGALESWEVSPDGLT